MFIDAYSQIEDNWAIASEKHIGTSVRKINRPHGEYMYLQNRYQGNRLSYMGPIGALTEASDREIAAIRRTQRTLTNNRKLIKSLRGRLRLNIPRKAQQIIRTLAAAGAFDEDFVLVGTLVIPVYLAAFNQRRDDLLMQTRDVDILNVSGKSSIRSALEAIELKPEILYELDINLGTVFYANDERWLDILMDREHYDPSELEPGVHGAPMEQISYLGENPLFWPYPGADGVRVKIPQPARFVWHKYIVAESRRGTLKGEKDLRQAIGIEELMKENKRYDLESLDGAWEALGSEQKVLVDAVKKRLE